MVSNPDRVLLNKTVHATRNASSPDPVDTDIIVNDILNNHMNDFVSNVSHAEEDPIVKKESRMCYDPNAIDKLTDVTKIEFDLASPTVDASKIDTFVANVTINLNLCGNKMREVLLLPIIIKVKRLREYMNMSRLIKEVRCSLRINEKRPYATTIQPMRHVSVLFALVCIWWSVESKC